MNYHKPSSEPNALNHLQPFALSNDMAQEIERQFTQQVQAVTRLSEAAIATVTQIGESVYEISRPAIEAATQVGDAVNQQVYHLLDQVTVRTGETVTAVSQLPLMDKLAGVLRLDWLINSGKNVDVSEAEAEVRRLQQQYPTESPEQIAQRIMNQKAAIASSMGFASSLIPGVAAALLAIDLAATTAIQAEMVYQIAAAYGFDLQAPERKGELVLIFGLALGGTNVVKAGLGILRNLPFAGSVIGASTNAAVLYAIGFAASRYYDAKRQAHGTPSAETLSTIQAESEAYWSSTVEQQAVMDQILTHMYLASHPEKSWEDVRASLIQTPINPDLSGSITRHLQQPQPLPTLLDHLQPEFALPILSRCYHMAKANGSDISVTESAILHQIAARFDLEYFLTDAVADEANIQTSSS